VYYLGRECTIFRINGKGTAISTCIPDTPSRHQVVSWADAGPTPHHTARSDQSGEHRKLDGTRAVASRPQSRLYNGGSGGIFCFPRHGRNSWELLSNRRNLAIQPSTQNLGKTEDRRPGSMNLLLFHILFRSTLWVICRNCLEFVLY
jgi:hypothetical protein